MSIEDITYTEFIDLNINQQSCIYRRLQEEEQPTTRLPEERITRPLEHGGVASDVTLMLPTLDVVGHRTYFFHITHNVKFNFI